MSNALFADYGLRRVLSYDGRDDLGMSSRNMWRQALGHTDNGWYAADDGDLGRCERLYERALDLAPDLAAKMLPILERNRAEVAARKAGRP